ncbi:MAG: MMPL family transporter, partial [Deltaproteobacteria bacterium]|nr:MMPL family transporter [Deltaproteobacteria bacterium]
MSGWLRSLESLAQGGGRAVLACTALLTALFAVGYASLEWTQDPEVITLEGSDELGFYREYLERWGSDELIVIAYPVEDAFDPAELVTLRSLTDALLDLEHVRWVWSLDTAFSIGTGPMGPYPRPLVADRIGSDPGLRERALSSAFVRDSLVSTDGRTLVVTVQLRGDELDNSESETRTLAAIDAVLARPEYAHLAPHLAGSPVFNRELSRLNQRDNALFTPLAVVIVAGLVLLLFRSALATALVMAVVGATVLWTQGAMSWLGVPMNITTSLLPPLLMVIAVADSVHLVTNYLDRLSRGEDRSAALHWTLREIVPPCFWTSVTTVCGFAAALGFVRIESVRTFAGFAVIGVAVAFALSVTLLPALLLRVPLEHAAHRRVERDRRRSAPGRRTDWTRPRPRLAVAIVAGALVLGAAGLPRVEVATHDGEFFAASNPINLAYRFIESRLQGVTPFEIEIRAPEPGALREASAVGAIATLHARLEAIPELTRGLSFVSLLESTSPSADLSDPAALERALFLLETLAPDDLEAWLDPDYQRARLSARADAMTSARSAELLAEVDAIARGLFPAG